MSVPRLWPTLSALIAFTLAAAPAPSASAEPVDFNRDIRPILSDNCYHCHGPDASSRKSGLRLDLQADALAGGRSDLSFTLFLSEPGSYQGGALVLEYPDGEEAVRLGAGDLIVYPSTLLHRVDPVTEGERLVCAGWIQSRLRSAEQRELLFELDTARRTVFSQQGKGEIFDLLSRSYTNLLRMWGE
jgi:PKHD-type hydroxylase